MRYLLVTLLLLTVQYSFGQFVRADHKKAAELGYRPLVVSLFEPGTEADNACDSAHMAWYNDHIGKIFQTYWTLSDSILFMNSRKVASLIASRSHEYVIFSAFPSREGQQSSGDIFWFPSFTFMLYLSEDGRKLDATTVDRGLHSESLIPDMEMTGQLSRGKYIFKLSFANMALSEHDLVLAIDQFEKNIREAISIKKSKSGIYASAIPKDMGAELRNKTLLIPENLDPDDPDPISIKKYYKYPFRILSDEKINNAISGKEQNTAFIYYLWSDHERMFQGFVIDTQTHDVLAAFRPGYVKLKKADCIPAGKSYRSLISMKTKHLKNIR